LLVVWTLNLKLARLLHIAVLITFCICWISLHFIQLFDFTTIDLVFNFIFH
jgi:hypothetical protein